MSLVSLFACLVVSSLAVSTQAFVGSGSRFHAATRSSSIAQKIQQQQSPSSSSGSSSSSRVSSSSHFMALSSVLPALLANPKIIAAGPVMYVLMSINEYVTHRYYQHEEFNKSSMLKKLSCMVMNLEKAPKIKGGGHVEHHAETYDDMTLKSDPLWRKTPAAKSLDADKYRGTAFTWTVNALMVIQMLPTAIPVFMLMGFSFVHTLAMIVPSILLHGLVWNALHPAMHGLDDVPMSTGPPSKIFSSFTKTPLFNFLYKNHQGHHVLAGQANYNVCCPLVDHLVGSFVPESQWVKQVRPVPTFVTQG